MMVMRTPPHRGILPGDKESPPQRPQQVEPASAEHLTTAPAGGQKVEGDGAADDLLHVGADDGQLHRQPQDDPRHLNASGNRSKDGGLPLLVSIATGI